MENRIDFLMQKLDISRAEAQQLIADDNAIDKGADLFPLTKEQQQASKKARQVAKAPTVYKFNKRERKTDNDKRFLIEILNTCLAENQAENIEITNLEREVVFFYNDKKYKIVLSAPRN